jgi:proteic killer suppression protein
VILSFRDKRLRAFFAEDVRSRKIPSDLEDVLFRKLQMIDDAAADSGLRAPPSSHLKKLKGQLTGFHSIGINKHCRLIFRWNGSRGEATGVYLDAHRYGGGEHVDNEAEAGGGRRSPTGGIPAAHGPDTGGAGGGDGRSAKARQ